MEMEPPPEIDWERSFLAYLHLLSHSTNHSSRARATLLAARLLPHAPPRLLEDFALALVPLLQPSSPPPLLHAALLALRRVRSPSLCSSAIPPLASLLSSSPHPLLVSCLKSLVSHHPSNRSLFASHGGVPAVLRALPPSSGSTRRRLLEILASLALSRDSRRSIVALRGLPYIVEAVSLGGIAFRTRAAHAIGYLGFTMRTKRVLLELGVADALVDLMRDGDSQAKIAAGNSLGIIATHPDNLWLVACAGAVPLYMELLEGAEPIGREIAEDALCVLAVDQENMVEICGHLARILGGGNNDAKAAAADVLWDISSYRHGMQTVRESGAVQLLVGILREGSGELLEKVSGALAQMSYEKDARVAMAESGAIPVLIDLIVCESDELKENATEALVNFSMDPQFHECVSAITNLPAFRSIRDRLARSNEYMERSLRLISSDSLASELGLA